MTALLLRSGAAIQEINVVRRQLSRLKGGGLARLARPARVLGLILSDVVGSPLASIASGPTVVDLAEPDAALAVADRYGLRGQLPAAVRQALARHRPAAGALAGGGEGGGGRGGEGGGGRGGYGRARRRDSG